MNESNDDSHWSQILYDIDNNNNSTDYYTLDASSLDIYKQESSALMLQANFRTSLDTKQKYEGKGIYGIGVAASFKNSLYSIGEKQGETGIDSKNKGL